MGRVRMAGLAALGLIAAAGLAFVADRKGSDDRAVRVASERPKLMLLTSLPLVFGEQFGIEGGGSPALTALETRYAVVPISVTDSGSLGQGGLLLMAQPNAQPPEMLVALDAWVRAGGRLVLLADPMLTWPSERALGDPLRPAPAFADTGLLAHWGLRLDAPAELGPKALQLGGKEILTSAPGQLFGSCAIAKDRLVAHCEIGKGRATVVADADFLNLADLDGPTAENFNGLLAELARLEQR